MAERVVLYTVCESGEQRGSASRLSVPSQAMAPQTESRMYEAGLAMCFADQIPGEDVRLSEHRSSCIDSYITGLTTACSAKVLVVDNGRELASARQ